MFVLNPGGKAGSAGGSQSSVFRQKLWFFGKLGIYFVGIRMAFLFMSGREEKKAIAAGESSSSSK